MEKFGIIKSSLTLINSRKEVIIALTWSTALATVIAGKGLPPISKSFLSIIAIMFITLSVYIYNDIIDREMDAYSIKESKKRRPIANGIVSENFAKKFVWITAGLGFITTLLISKTAFIIGLFYYILYFLYSYPQVRFKNKFIMKNIVTSSAMPISFLLGGIAVENSLSTTIAFLAGTYFIFLFLTLPAGADCVDIEEDRAFNVKTIGGTLTWRQNILLFNLGILLMILSAFTLYKIFGMNYLPPVLMASIGVPIIIYNISISNLDSLKGIDKLRPVGYTYLMMTHLILTLGVLF